MRVLITGGAGFIGCNTADQLMTQGHDVAILDNLSRAGSEKNLSWLQQRHRDFPFFKTDIRHADSLRTALQQHPPELLLHLAAQVAVTTSVEKPYEDFQINALGTLNVLEAVRELRLNPVVLFASTNKVYGKLAGLPLREGKQRYEVEGERAGIGEDAHLDFYSPYGCSKGAADQYVRDYHRIYGLRTIVFRNSCIYGPRQFGVEDQGWLAWFVIAAVLGRAITIYGDGKQVRDVLHVHDLIRAMLQAVEAGEVTQGQVYNIGGGLRNSIAVWTEFGPLLEEILGRPIPVTHEEWRPGDQLYYVSDTSKAGHDFGWEPRVGVEEGVGRLADWVRANRTLFG
jgi:CDP-paratose 2-epimerase